VRQIIGSASVAGFFCNGEFGPVGSRSFVQSYTASLVLFVGPPRGSEDEL
jgi:small ligand-binding sensory domain FIST